jgi:AraC family transcriptional regulator
MSTEQPIRIDAAASDSFNPLLPKPLILSSRKADWGSFYFAYHRQSPYSIPETYPAQHTINICTNPFSAKIKLNGHWQQRWCEVGDCGIFPSQQVAPATIFEQELGIIHLYLEPASLAQVAFESVDAERIEIVQQLIVHDPLILQLGLSLKQELEVGAVDSRLYASTVATMLAVHLLKRYSAHQPVFSERTGGLSNYNLRAAIAYINDNLEQNISLTEIATIVHMSPHYFATLFKQSTGVAPHQYLIQCRIERAKHYLTKNLSITQVSQLVGYQSQSHFAKVFRKHVGITPKQYQQR